MVFRHGVPALIGKRVRRQQWLLLAAVIAASAIAAALSRALLPTVITSSLAAGLGALAVAIESHIANSIERDSAESRTSARLILRTSDGRVPRVSELGDPIALGVHPARPTTGRYGALNRVPDFVARDVSDSLCAALIRSDFVLISGDSTSGKTRLAYESVRSSLADHVLIVPSGKDGLRDILSQTRDIRRAAVWLDDIERFLGPGGLTSVDIASFLSDSDGHRVIVATIRTNERARLSRRRLGAEVDGADMEAFRAAREVLDMAEEYRLERIWSAREIDRARRTSRDPRVGAALRHVTSVGVAEYMAAGPQLLTDWLDAWSPGAHPRGAALVAAAVDARRAGYHRPLELSLLERLHRTYLERRGGAALRPETLSEALMWATTPVASTRSMLEIGREGVEVFDYLLDSVDANQTRNPVPYETWLALIEGVSDSEAEEIGAVAYYWRLLDVARNAFSKASASGLPRSRIMEAHCVGKLGEAAAAADLFAGIVRDLGAAHADDDRDLLHACHELAFWSAETGTATDRVVEFQKVMTDRGRALGKNHPDTMASRHAYAEAVARSGRMREGLALFREVVDNQTTVLGATDVATMHSRHQLAWWTGQVGEIAQAVGQYQRLEEDRASILGQSHPDTVASRDQLRYWQARLADSPPPRHPER